jgi:DGQHR domain-containing protein
MDFNPNNKIIGLPVIQNQQEFLVGVFTISKILTFTRYTKRLIRGYDEDNEPIYNDEIQRAIENSRVDKIADFLIYDPEATFPTNLVFHIPIQVIEKQINHGSFLEIYLDEKVFDELKKEKQSPDKGNIYITIIDGQHRLKGIEEAINKLQSLIDTSVRALHTRPDNKEYQSKVDYFTQRLKDLLNIDLVVSFFIDKAPEYQAMIFSTINRTQKRVSESLVYSLFGLTTEDSPQKTSLQVVISLNSKSQSPFYNRIKLYGGEYETNQSPPLSQAAMVKSIIANISETLRESETDRFKSRKQLFQRSPGSIKPLPFRQYYAANQDTKISDIFYYYFTAVKEVFLNIEGQSYWDFNPDSMKPTNVLHTTVGYNALLKILVDILSEIKESEKFNKVTYIGKLNKAKKTNFMDLKRYPFTSISATRLYLDLSLAIWPATSNEDARLSKLAQSLKEDN